MERFLLESERPPCSRTNLGKIVRAGGLQNSFGMACDIPRYPCVADCVRVVCGGVHVGGAVPSRAAFKCPGHAGKEKQKAKKYGPKLFHADPREQ